MKIIVSAIWSTSKHLWSYKAAPWWRLRREQRRSECRIKWGAGVSQSCSNWARCTWEQWDICHIGNNPQHVIGAQPRPRMKEVNTNEMSKRRLKAYFERIKTIYYLRLEMVGPAQVKCMKMSVDLSKKQLQTKGWWGAAEKRKSVNEYNFQPLAIN